jgi:hypothetical protein
VGLALICPIGIVRVAQHYRSLEDTQVPRNMRPKPRHVKKDRAQFATSAALSFMIAVEYLGDAAKSEQRSESYPHQRHYSYVRENNTLALSFLAKEKSPMRVDSLKVCGYKFLRSCHPDGRGPGRLNIERGLRVRRLPRLCPSILQNC